MGHTTQAVSSARAARKKRWICFGIFVLLLIIVAIVIAVVVINNKSEWSSITPILTRLLTIFRRINAPRSSRSHDRTSAFLYSHTLVPSCSVSSFLPQSLTTGTSCPRAVTYFQFLT